MIFEDIQSDPLKFIQRIYEFLGIEKDFTPSIIKEKINFIASNRRIFPFLTKFFYKTRAVLNRYKTGRAIISLSKKLKADKFLKRILKYNLRDIKDKKLKEMEKQDINKETRQRLLNFYQKDILELEKITGICLDHWRIN